MLRLSKRVEYGLIAMKHFASVERGTVSTAKEIAQKYTIPYELLAKVLQNLAQAGLIQSYQGVRGGYVLSHNPKEIKVSDVISAIEKEKPMLAECYVEGPESCIIFDDCTIRKPLGKIQKNINTFFEKMTIAEIL
jgi:Rrf2 family transcriptional regulator, cysteine metabolism repressor